MLAIYVTERLRVILRILWFQYTATWSKRRQLSSLQASLPLSKKLKGNCGIDARGRGWSARDRLRRSVFAHLVAWISHTQDCGLGQRYITVSGQVRRVDKIRQGRDIKHLRCTVVGDNHCLKDALGVLFDMKVRPVDGRCPIRVLNALCRGEDAGRASPQLNRRQASGQNHLEINVLRGLLALDSDGDLGLLSACHDPALEIGACLGVKNQTGTVLGDGRRCPGAA